MKKLSYLLVILAFVSCNTASKNSDKGTTEDVKLVETTIHVGGMHCNNCVASVEKGIKNLEGIENVVVTLEDSTAVVKYNESKLELATIEKAVEKRGYSVKKQ